MASVLSFIVGYYAFTTIVCYKYFSACAKTYRALNSFDYILDENFQGTRYFKHKSQTENWCDVWLKERDNMIIVMEDGSVKLVGGDSRYLHSGLLPYVMHPILGYWRIKFNRLIKHLP